MESAYSLAAKELNDIQYENKMMQEYRHSEICAKIPEIEKIEAELIGLGTRLLKCVLNSGKDYENIKEEIQKRQFRKKQLLALNGYPEDYLGEIYNCEKCKDTGFVNGLRCNCFKQLVLKHIGTNSNLTELMKSQTFESFDFSLFDGQDEINGRSPSKITRRLFDICLEFSNSFDKKSKKNILILGNAGTGKTYLSSCIANRAIERGKTVYYQSAYRLFEMLEQVKFGKGDSEELKDVSNYVYDVDLLIIDDLGTEFVTQFTTAALFDIINSRIISSKSTIVSSNLSFEDMHKMYSQRLTSRLAGEYVHLQTLGKDLRLKF